MKGNKRTSRLACIYIIVVAASYLVITYVGQRTEVSGSSMETTLSDGDQLIVDKYHTGSAIRAVTILSYFHIGMKKIHIISRGSSDFRRDSADCGRCCLDQRTASS